jgi:phosphoribosylanthranilate isomerase
MTQQDQVEQLPDLGATFAGFIFYPKSPRYVFRHMTSSQLKKINCINKVGVFVNASVEEVLLMVDECRLHMVQLHGDEPPKYCERISNYVSVVKAFRLSDDDSIKWMTDPFTDVSDMFMFDTTGAGYGGTGKKFDWNILKGHDIGKPFFLSGGIQPDDIHALKEFAAEPVAKELFAIDINSKFESSPGVKEMDKVGKFIRELRSPGNT